MFLHEQTIKFKLEKQIAMRSQKKFTFIDLFAGIGGLRIGFESAGGECIFSSEIDKYAVKTYEYMFRDRSAHKPAGDITKIDARDIPSHDILVGGFPCQPFSIAGVPKYNALGLKNGFEHPTKGTLFFDIVRILDFHKPKAFFLENVKNLKSHDKGRTWKTISKSLLDLHYDVYDKVFDAKLLVPQHRERIFIIGIRNDLKIPFMFPVIPNTHPKLKDILDKQPDKKYTLSNHLWEYLQNYAKKHKKSGNGFGYSIANPEGITRTLSARYYKDGAEILIEQPGNCPRRLTPSEAARLQGFPKDWQHPIVSDTQAYKQFGNAVAVPLVVILAKHLIKTLEEKNILYN